MIKKPKILFVDDDSLVLQATSLYLKQAPFSIIFGSNAKECFDSLQKNNNIDLILLDLMLPDMDGLSILRKLRQTPLWEKTPIIIQTGSSSFDKKSIINLYAKILYKPYSKNELLNAINMSLSNYKTYL